MTLVSIEVALFGRNVVYISGISRYSQRNLAGSNLVTKYTSPGQGQAKITTIVKKPISPT